MPDDPIIDPKQTSGGDPGSNGSEPAAGSAPLSLEAAAELVSQAIAPMAQRLEELGQTNAQLAEQLQAAGAQSSGTPASTQTEEDFLTRFSNDPEGTVREIANDGIKQAAPLMVSLINSTVSNFTQTEASNINAEFGDGAWEKYFEKPLGIIIDSYRKNNAPALADHKTITKEVEGLKGRQFEDLVNFRTESRKASEEGTKNEKGELIKEATEAVLQQTNLTGGLRRISGGEEEITEGLKGYLAEREASIGQKEDPKDFLSRTDYGNTYEDFLAHQAKQKAAEGGTQ